MTLLWSLAVALLAQLLIGRAAAPPLVASTAWTDMGTLVSAPDGDTMRIRTVKHGVVTVRVAGIDSPEHGQACWREARAHLVKFVGAGNLMVACHKTDRYGRHVCGVKSGNRDLGASLVEAGLAWHYKRFETEQSPDERRLYAQLELNARNGQLGLWQDSDPMPPEACRKERRARKKCR